MKIAILAPYWNPPRFRGGISRVIYELRRVWVAEGHQVDVFGPRVRHCPTEGTFRIPVPPMPLQAVWVCLYLAVSRRLATYDVIFPQTALLALLADRRRCIPFVHTLTSEETRGSRWRIWRSLYPVLETVALRGVRRVITLAEPTRRLLVAHHRVPEKVVARISNGVDIDRFRPAGSPPGPGFTVAAAGRFIPRKRFDLLLRAFATVARGRPDARLVLAGEGPEGAALRALAAKLRVTDRVEFPGLLDEEALLRLYWKAHVFCLPSVTEGAPMVVLEAQACGVPVVVGPFASAPEMVENGLTGYIVEQDDPEAWASTLLGLAADEGCRAAMGRAARARTVELFTWTYAARRILAYFQPEPG